ncbi:Thymidylate kinase [Hyphodiscus hymeniophilus]|uniref:Thymidylate kinase n=1 Tax=Hyphodiscus hymeniophilus TaxID=353542 RepID=A0A9P7AUJ5_9HELO|nr:Thymidylate kinase [Hyphodiscus hymeniophilus]
MSASEEYPWKGPATTGTRGAFIVVEGLDRAGKTTQVKKLCETLYASGRNVKTLRFPDRTSPIGKMIDSYLQSKTEMDDHAIHLLFSANRWEKAKHIRGTIAQGYTIVCDRYYYSGMVYSAAKNNPALDLQWARQCDVGLPRPDKVIFLDLEPEQAEKRGGFGDEKYEKKEMQKEVRWEFMRLRFTPGESSDMIVVNAGPAIEEVAEKIWQDIHPTLTMIQEGMLNELGTVKAWRDDDVEWLGAKVLGGARS